MHSALSSGLTMRRKNRLEIQFNRQYNCDEKNISFVRRTNRHDELIVSDDYSSQYKYDHLQDIQIVSKYFLTSNFFKTNDRNNSKNICQIDYNET